MKIDADTRAARNPSASSLYMLLRSPSWELPSRSVGPDPAMIITMGAFLPALRLISFSSTAFNASPSFSTVPLTLTSPLATCR